MSIVNSLKKLVCALGGASEPSSVPGDNISEVVDEITKVAKPGGAEYFDFYFYADAETGDVNECSATFEELITAINNDKILRPIYSGRYGMLLAYSDTDILFLNVTYYQKTLSFWIIDVSVENTYTTKVWNVTRA